METEIQKDKILLHVNLTRAENLTEKQREDAGIIEKEGLVIEEFYLSLSELKEEYKQIRELDEEKGFFKYVQFMRETCSSCIDKTNKMNKRY